MTSHHANHRPAPIPGKSPVHFGIRIYRRRDYGFKLERDTYAPINKRSSMNRWSREENPELWDALNERYEDADHRIYTDEWCATQQVRALTNFDHNMTFFRALDHNVFENALQRVVAGRKGMVEVSDLNEWDGVPGIYIMVLDEYSQVYVGATGSKGIMARIKQHWGKMKSFDRLIWGDVDTSVLSIDSFRAFDTTRIFAVKTGRHFELENAFLEAFPPEFVLNRVQGGLDVAPLAQIFGVEAISRKRDFSSDNQVTHG